MYIVRGLAGNRWLAQQVQVKSVYWRGAVYRDGSWLQGMYKAWGGGALSFQHQGMGEAESPGGNYSLWPAAGGTEHWSVGVVGGRVMIPLLLTSFSFYLLILASAHSLVNPTKSRKARNSPRRAQSQVGEEERNPLCWWDPISDSGLKGSYTMVWTCCPV